jgi:hypothetical protein
MLVCCSRCGFESATVYIVEGLCVGCRVADSDIGCPTYCGCGGGKEVPQVTKKGGRPREYLDGHYGDRKRLLRKTRLRASLYASSRP